MPINHSVRIGNFEKIVLYSAQQLGSRTCPTTIVEFLEKKLGRAISHDQVISTIDILLLRGFLELQSHIDPDTGCTLGFYKQTPRGIIILNTALIKDKVPPKNQT